MVYLEDNNERNYNVTIEGGNCKEHRYAALKLAIFVIPLKSSFMDLTMKVNEQVLDSIKVYAPMCGDERYLIWLTKELQQRHRQTILAARSEPVILLSKLVND